MTSATYRQAVADYLSEVKVAMWLGHWRIDIFWKASDANYATCDPTYGQHHAELWLGQHFIDAKPWKQRNVLVHELIHCHMADAQAMGEELETNLGDQAYQAWKSGFRLALEHGVDSLATVLAHEDSTFIPLPRFPDSEASASDGAATTRVTP